MCFPLCGSIHSAWWSGWTVGVGAGSGGQKVSLFEWERQLDGLLVALAEGDLHLLAGLSRVGQLRRDAQLGAERAPVGDVLPLDRNDDHPGLHAGLLGGA